MEITLLPELTASLIIGAIFSKEEEVAIITISTFSFEITIFKLDSIIKSSVSLKSRRSLNFLPISLGSLSIAPFRAIFLRLRRRFVIN